MALDRIDRKLLEHLQNNSQISNQDLAEKVALSPSPCSRRVKQLEEEGYIDKYVALLSPEKLGLHLTVQVLVSLDSHSADRMSLFERSIVTFPEVIECHLITGQDADYVLKVMVSNLDHYQHFLLKKLTTIKGVSGVHSSFVLRSIVNKTQLPIF